MSVPMALVDYIPDILFLIAAITLQRGLYYRMSKGAFAVFSAGTIMIFCAGLFKATWKLLLSLGICDFERLSQCFFPMQSVGFLLAGAGYRFNLTGNTGIALRAFYELKVALKADDVYRSTLGQFHSLGFRVSYEF